MRRADGAQIAATLARASRASRGPVNVLIHNAVGGAFGDFQQIEPEVLQRNFATNTMALFHLARGVAPAMPVSATGRSW